MEVLTGVGDQWGDRIPRMSSSQPGKERWGLGAFLDFESETIIVRAVI